MGRLAREISPTGLYHIVFRGINKQNIFEESEDYKKIIEIIQNIKDEHDFEIYAYCLMSNHVHLLIKEAFSGDISQIMKRILTRYVMWFNRKYNRSGALIANRYKSQPVAIDEYFLSVVRYIHQNPLKANLVDKISDYSWSSYNDYIKEQETLVDRRFVIEMLPVSEFEQFHKIEEKEIFCVNDKLKKTDESIRRYIIQNLKIEPKVIGTLEKNERNSILKQLKSMYSIRQIERVTGISRGIIAKS